MSVSEKKNKINIAIDGFSSCGKSTLAKALAKELDYLFIDSGAMYRAIAYYCFQQKLVSQDFVDVNKIIIALPNITIDFEFNPSSSKMEVRLNGENVEGKIRTLEISQLVSKVAAIREVRLKLVEEQQKMGEKGGVVMDGRDIGSIVFPNAELKLFITADPDIRAERRFLELNDASISKADVLKNLMERDHLDSTREESPLIKTADAIEIDNSNLTPQEQLNKVLEIVKSL